MKMANIFLSLIFLLTFNFKSHAQQNKKSAEYLITATQKDVNSKKKQLNFFIISKRKKGNLDLATRFNVFRTKLKGLFRQSKFVSLIAENGEEMSAKVQLYLKKYNARIGTIWFDSHGIYKKGYSLFLIGSNEYSYITLKDSAITRPFRELIPFVDEETMVVIGSCYGGATYTRTSIDYKDTTRMNGDSLMIAFGELFNKPTVYACESWVMTKPGLFLKKAAVGGFPGRKLFLDYCYEPVWKNVGRWNKYNADTNIFESSNPIAIDMYGNIVIRGQSYIEEKNNGHNIEKNLQNMKSGVYK